MNNWQNKNFETLLVEFVAFSKEIEILVKKLNIKLNVPFNIEELARKLGISIDEHHHIIGKSWGYFSNNSATLKNNICYKDKRWLIAKIVANHIKDITKLSNALCNPCFVYNHMDDFYLDALASLLLVPISIFKHELSTYISDNRHKDKVEILTSNDFIEYMSDRFQVPIFQLSITHRLICQILCFERYKEFEKYNFDITKVPLDSYEIIFI